MVYNQLGETELNIVYTTSNIVREDYESDPNSLVHVEAMTFLIIAHYY